MCFYWLLFASPLDPISSLVDHLSRYVQSGRQTSQSVFTAMGVESDTTCSPVPVSDVTWQTTVLAADKIYQHSHASWPWPRPARRLKWHLRLTLPTNWDRNDRIWHCQPIAPRPATQTMVKTYTYARSHQAWGVETQLERCAVSLDTAAATTQSALKYWWQRNEVRKKLATFKILRSPVTDSSKAYNNNNNHIYTALWEVAL